MFLLFQQLDGCSQFDGHRLQHDEKTVKACCHVLCHLVIELLIQECFLHVRDQCLRIIDRVKDQLKFFVEEVGRQLLDAAHHTGLLPHHIVDTCRQAMAIAQVQLKLRWHSFRSVIVQRRIRLDHHLLVCHLNRHLVLPPTYEWVDAVNKIAMNCWRSVARAFAKLSTKHDAGVHDPIVVNHV
jgi:hypothetical protein